MSPTSDERQRQFRKISLEEGTYPVIPSRGARMPRFVSLSPSTDPTSVLSRLRVACLGVGAVGRNTCLHIARLGVSTLWICDRNRYKPESLLTQPADTDEVGAPKAAVVGRLAKRLSPSTEVYAYCGPFAALGPAALADADLVVMATDNIRAEIECGQQCMHLGKPLIHASVHGSTLTAQVRFYANTSADDPCPACALTKMEQSALVNEVAFSCDGSTGRAVGAPTMSTSHLCALAGDLAANQVLRFALELGSDVVNRSIEWNGFTMRTHDVPLERSPRCPIDHAVWKTRTAPRTVADTTLRDIARSSGIREDRIDRTSFRVGETSFVQRAVCPRGHSSPVERFVENGTAVGACTTCGKPLVPEPYFNLDAAPGRLLRKQLDRPLGKLCMTRPEWVLVRENGTAVLMRSANDIRDTNGKEYRDDS